MAHSPAEPIAAVRKSVPNTERSARTREKLLLATIDCLYRLGYHETSTSVVLKQAGVSRGAMLHQFPTKADLMLATSEYIRNLRGEAHRRKLHGVTDDYEHLDKRVDILWGEMKTPSGVARIEIMLGSRSDPLFAARFNELNQELETAHKDRFWMLAERLGVEDRALSDSVVQLFAASLRGLAVDALQPGSKKKVDAAVELLKRYHRLLIADLAAKS